MGTKRSILTDKKGIPLSVVLSGANTHDSKLLEDTLDNIVILRPSPKAEKPQNLCLDAGYIGCEEVVKERVTQHTFVPEARRRKNWKPIRISMPDAGLLRSHTPL